MQVKSSVKPHLSFLYGESAAIELEDAVQKLIRQAREGRVRDVSEKNKPTETDCMLITYGEVRADSESPLKTLDRFLVALRWRDQCCPSSSLLSEFRRTTAFR